MVAVVQKSALHHGWVVVGEEEEVPLLLAQEAGAVEGERSTPLLAPWQAVVVEALALQRPLPLA